MLTLLFLKQEKCVFGFLTLVIGVALCAIGFTAVGFSFSLLFLALGVVGLALIAISLWKIRKDFAGFPY